MTTEISKMFENAGINKRCCCANIKFDDCIYSPSDCGYYNYPDFTTEKQLKIIEWFISSSNKWWLNWLLNIASLDKTHDFSLDEKLAKLVNRLWESFDDQEKEEIRNILNA